MAEQNWQLQQCLLQLQEDVNSFYEAWIYEKRKRWINRQVYRKAIFRRRRRLGHFFTLFQELKSDPKNFFKYTRMTLKSFNQLLFLVQPKIIILKPRIDVPIAEERLAITLRYLASGDSIFSLATNYRLSETTVYRIIKATCRAIIKALFPRYLRKPTKPVLKNIAEGFWRDWNLPKCCGAIDGTLVEISAPKQSGSLYYNYKKYYSVNILAVCNHRYEFTMVDVGAYGGESDGGILGRSPIRKYLYDGDNLPPNENLPGTNISVPFYFVGDEAFRMTDHLMRPYPGTGLSKNQRIFNYRLSRARRCIENAFGILFNRFQVFQKPIQFDPSEADVIILACICLHNFLMAKTQKSKRLKKVFNARIVDNVVFDNHVLSVREKLANYLISRVGKVDWQDEYIQLGRHRDTNE